MDMFERLLIAYYLVACGIWGFFLKIITKNLGWKDSLLYVWIGLSLSYFVLVFRTLHLSWGRYQAFAVFTGIVAGLATIVFYKLLSLKPASVIIPLSVQYILITVLLCVIFLKEPLNLRIIAGIICSVLSIILLAK